jgi:glycosyltransferase involved in cell wall biosynthesis
LSDTGTLVRLAARLRQLKPDIVNASTPKAGLLGMVAAKLAGVPVRIYTLRGLRGETKRGISQMILRQTERIASSCAHHVICVSESLRSRYLELERAPESKVTVLKKGSSNGVDASHFVPSANEEAAELRLKLGIAPGDPVIGFVGRLVKDKGVAELLECFELLLKSFPNLRLLIIGDFEQGDPVAPDFARRVREDPRIIHCGFVSDPAPYYQAMHVLVFPSYREGFPNAPLEAAASGVPVVGFRVTGTVDAIEDEVTGRLVNFGDVPGLATAAGSYLKDDALRSKHGHAGRERVLQNFQQEIIWTAVYEKYLSWLSEVNRQGVHK